MNRSFFSQMALSSALALIRGFVLAQILAPESFGRYAMVVAAGTFAASLLGLGRIEQTNKRFPRLFADGHAREALGEADAIGQLLLIRALVAGITIIAITLLVGVPDWTMGILCGVAVSLTVGWQSTYASVHRAGGELISLAHSNLARTALALTLAALGGYLLSWQGAVIGEVAAAATGAWISRRFAWRLSLTARPRETAPAAPNTDLWLFAAFLIGSIPVYLDRLLVSALYGSEATGQYSVLMLFVTGASTLMSIIVQKLGPQVVRLVHERASFRSQITLVAAWSTGAIALVATGMAFAAVALLYGPLLPLAEKYNLGSTTLVATSLLCVAQVSVILDWLLLAHDRERWLFAAVVAYLAALAAGIAIVAATRADMIALLWVVAAAKCLQVFVQITFILLTVIRQTAAIRRADQAEPL